MPRRPRRAAGALAYHVLNRRVGRLPLCEKPADYAAFETILAEAHNRTGIRLTAYCLIPNHWHLLLWPRRDGELSEVRRWITVTHTQRWHAHHHTAGTGPVYQGRFKSFPVQTDEHFLTVARYVERNAVRAKLVTRARREQGHSTFLIDLGGGVRSGLTGWCRRELGAAGFEAVPAGFQGGDVRFEGVDTLVVLGKWEPQEGPHFFELVTNLPTGFMQFMPNSDVTFRDLANVAPQRFGHHAKMTFDLFHLFGVHGSLV